MDDVAGMADQRSWLGHRGRVTGGEQGRGEIASAGARSRVRAIFLVWHQHIHSFSQRRLIHHLSFNPYMVVYVSMEAQLSRRRRLWYSIRWSVDRKLSPVGLCQPNDLSLLLT